MGDSDENEAKPATSPPDVAPADDPVDLREVARQFLQDDQVKASSREKKVEYLKEKGLSDDDITALLDEADKEETQTASTTDSSQPPQEEPQSIAETQPQTQQLDSRSQDPPPIITYPEFLTKPSRPPPLVTGTALLNTLYACAGLTTLVYGTSKYAVAPMVESLTAARFDLHATASEKLSALTRLLESTVSEIPPTTSPRGAAGADFKDTDSTTSSADDPTELFHRDIGVQTSLPPSPDPAATAPPTSAASAAAAKLVSLTASLRDLSETAVSQSEDLADVKAVIDLLKDDLGNLTFPGSATDFVGGFSLYGSGNNKNEPDDEMKKARDNVRRVKGVLLSTRNFPSSTAR